VLIVVEIDFFLVGVGDVLPMDGALIPDISVGQEPTTTVARAGGGILLGPGSNSHLDVSSLTHRSFSLHRHYVIGVEAEPTKIDFLP